MEILCSCCNFDVNDKSWQVGTVALKWVAMWRHVGRWGLRQFITTSELPEKWRIKYWVPFTREYQLSLKECSHSNCFRALNWRFFLDFGCCTPWIIWHLQKHKPRDREGNSKRKNLDLVFIKLLWWSSVLTKKTLVETIAQNKHFNVQTRRVLSCHGETRKRFVRLI